MKISSNDENLDYVDTIEFNSYNEIRFKRKNRDLAEQLFNYVCNILENNKNIKLDKETLKRLLNSNPTSLSSTIEEKYVARTFDFEKLSGIIRKNETIKKSNINIEEIYIILIETCQIYNEEVFVDLVTPEQYKENHKLIDEILPWCNAKVFIEVTNIIRQNYDKDFDRFSIIKRKNENKFCGKLIMELLNGHTNEETYDLIHQILSDSEIELDYNMYYCDYTGESDLKSIIALSENKTIIKDMMNKTTSKSYYAHGEYGIELFIIYAIISEYEKALKEFEKKYKFESNLDDEDRNLDTNGYAYGRWGYEDSLAKFISKMCKSLQEDQKDNETIINLINQIINSENVKYINLEETLKPIQEIFSPEDFKLLIDAILEKHKLGKVKFLTISVHENMYTRYKISIANEEEIENQLRNLNKEEQTKKLVP